MRTSGAARITNRRSFLNGVTMAGAAALTPSSTRAASSNVRMAQASQAAGGAATALTVKSVGRLAGSSTGYAYAFKAGPWIFLTGHEAFDFERGPAPEVDGPAGYPLSGRPP